MVSLGAQPRRVAQVLISYHLYNAIINFINYSHLRMTRIPDSLAPTDTISTPDSSGNSTQAPTATCYDSPEGRALVRKILIEALPYEPHDYIVDGICPVLDGRDLLATAATGGGKTGFFVATMLVMHAISRDPTLALGGKTFPKNPIMILICPTKALQEDMVSATFMVPPRNSHLRTFSLQN